MYHTRHSSVVDNLASSLHSLTPGETQTHLHPLHDRGHVERRESYDQIGPSLHASLYLNAYMYMYFGICNRPSVRDQSGQPCQCPAGLVAGCVRVGQWRLGHQRVQGQNRGAVVPGVSNLPHLLLFLVTTCNVFLRLSSIAAYINASSQAKNAAV